ncbi:MAG: mitochondrial fission ELM1 family protein [Alphaproteobacteria bacterium]
MLAPSVTGWVIHNGDAGYVGPCLGLARALGLDPVVKIVKPGRLHHFLAPYGPAAPDPQFSPPWPGIIIASGRQSVPYARMIKRKSRGRVFSVFIQSPVIDPKHFDLICVPTHDNLRGNNVLATLTAPNIVTREALNTAKAEFAPLFAALPRPLLGIIIGGANAVYALGLAQIDAIADQLLALHATGGHGLAITCSRRTGPGIENRLRQRLADVPAFIWDGTGKNPYFGILAHADTLMVTCDSVNMVGEAAFTGTPVYMLPLPGGSDKFARFHEGIVHSGAVRWFDGTLESWNYTPVDSTTIMANAVAQAFARRNGG